MSWYHDAYGPEDAESWLRQALAGRDAGTSCHFAICDSTSTLRGVIGFEDLTGPGGQAMIGYWVATPATGRGLGTSAVGDALSWARTNTQLALVWAIVAEAKVPSRRVLEANRFCSVRVDKHNISGDPQLIYELSLLAS
jgi:RimJ/RimL family protein N-acetyltransferase